MKKTLLYSLLIILCSCNESKKDSLLGKVFTDHKEISAFEDFEKVSDTSFMDEEYESAYSILHLKKPENNLIIFSSIDSYLQGPRRYKILDTLIISKLNKSEKITIGYCALDLKKNDTDNTIAVIEKADEKKMFNQNIKAAWIADDRSKKIDGIKNFEEVDCFNPWYNGGEKPIDYTELE